MGSIRIFETEYVSNKCFIEEKIHSTLDKSLFIVFPKWQYLTQKSEMIIAWCFQVKLTQMWQITVWPDVKSNLWKDERNNEFSNCLKKNIKKLCFLSNFQLLDRLIKDLVVNTLQTFQYQVVPLIKYSHAQNSSYLKYLSPM